MPSTLPAPCERDNLAGSESPSHCGHWLLLFGVLPSCDTRCREACRLSCPSLWVRGHRRAGRHLVTVTPNAHTLLCVHMAEVPACVSCTALDTLFPPSLPFCPHCESLSLCWGLVPPHGGTGCLNSCPDKFLNTTGSSAVSAVKFRLEDTKGAPTSPERQAVREHCSLPQPPACPLCELSGPLGWSLQEHLGILDGK